MTRCFLYIRGRTFDERNTFPAITTALLSSPRSSSMHEIKPSPSYRPWGPFIPENYQLLRVTQLDIALASTAFALAGVFAISAAYVAIRQTRQISKPWRSVYLWLVWLEWAASVVIAIECLLFLLRIIRPSFYFFMSICVSNRYRTSEAKLTCLSTVLDYPDPTSTPDYPQSNPNYPTQ